MPGDFEGALRDTKRAVLGQECMSSDRSDGAGIKKAVSKDGGNAFTPQPPALGGDSKISLPRALRPFGSITVEHRKVLETAAMQGSGDHLLSYRRQSG